MIAEPRVDEVLREACEAIAADAPVIRALPFGGRIRIERPLPFLFVCRDPSPSEGTESLVTGHPAYVVLPADERFDAVGRELVVGITEALVARWPAVCVLEPAFSELDPHLHTDELHSAPPLFRAWLGPDDRWLDLGDDVALALESISVEGHVAQPVTLHRSPERALPSRASLLENDHPADAAVCWVGLEVQPIFRDARTGRPYPPVLEDLHRGLTRQLRIVMSAFARRHAGWTPHSPAVLARHLVDDATERTDEILVHVGGRFDFLLQLTPANLRHCWQELVESAFERVPELEYRPLAVNTSLLKRRLFDAPVEGIEDPTLAALYRERQEELDRMLSMLRDRGDAFLYESLQVYGYPDDRLLALARLVLDEVPVEEPTGEPTIGVDELLRRARQELRTYAAQHGSFPRRIEVRDDVAAGLMVSEGKLLLNPDVRVPLSRADALIEHEIGTHVVTWFNGMAQPLELFGHGLARYEATQEGLAVLSEWLTGGLTTTRMRILAARVLAARDVADGGSFVDIYRRLVREHLLPARAAFQTTVRALRGGGLTKDMAYLDGFVRILEYLRDGGDLLPLYAGKLSLHHLPEIDELQRRELLRLPTVRPRVIDRPSAQERLDRVRQGGPVEELLRGIARELSGAAERVG